MQEDSYYGYNPHTDVETLTKEGGDTRATYGYTAYGTDDKQAFTGIDKPDTQNPGKEPYNFYRYTGKRFNPATGSYDMGFRDYNPGLNRFLTRDTYNGALADLNLGTNPWTGNRYAFTGGNPINRVEIDGHDWFDDYLNMIAPSTPDPAPDPNAPPQPLPATGKTVTPAKPPAVANEDLRKILDDSYLRPGAREEWVGRGTTADALRHELDTGNQVQGKWHYQKGADQFNRLSEWLDDVRRGRITASQDDIDKARGEAADLWNALNTKDRGGKVTPEIRSKDAAGDKNFRNAIDKATSRAAVSDITGTPFDYDERGKPKRTGRPRFGAGAFIALDIFGYAVDVKNYGWQDATFDLIDVTGIGRQYLESLANMQRYGTA